MFSNEIVSVSSTAVRRGALGAIVVGNVVAVMLLLMSSERQYPTYARNGSGIQISSVAYPKVFYPLAWSHVCLASISLAKAQWRFLYRLALAVGTSWIWSLIIDRYSDDVFERVAAPFMVAGSVIYLGLIVGIQHDAGKSRIWTTIRSCRQISIGHLFVAIAWIGLWINLEHNHVRRSGLISIVMSYLSYPLPFAVLSLALVMAVHPKRSRDTKGPESVKLVARIVLAIGMGVGLIVVASSLVGVRTYFWILHSGPPAMPTRLFFSLTMEMILSMILSESTRITTCGFMIVPWLLVARLSSREAPKGHGLESPI